MRTAAAGMQDAQWRADIAAHNVANVSTGGFRTVQVDRLLPAPGPRDTPSDVDLGKQITDLMVANRVYSANARVVRTADEMAGTLLDVRA